MALFLDLSPPEDSSESPHCSLDNNIEHILNLLDSPSEHPRNGDMLSDYNDDVPDTQPISGQILKDVVAYVEARSGNDNRSGAISRELELLGARVEKKLTPDVTHVVFKAGSKMTQERARKRGLHLVSVLWVDSCKQNLKHMSELLFPVVPADTRRTPVFAGRLKKLKSMQPKDFEDDVASSADRGQKRRRRQLQADKWKVLETPGAGLLQGAAHAYVEETQPRSPTDTTPLPFNLTVPDTPPSMREKLNSLRKKRLSLQHFAECSTTTTVKENEPLQRRLFGLPEDDSSPQPTLATPEIETVKDEDVKQMKEFNAVGQEAEEEDPIPVHLVGSSTVCVPNRRHRLLPVNQEPCTELLQPVYTDQCRRPGQNHFFPEIASQKPGKTKCGGKGRGEGIKSRTEGKGGGKKSGKRKNGSSRECETQEEDESRKRRRYGAMQDTEWSLTVAGLASPVRDVAPVNEATTSSRRQSRLQAGDSHAVNTDLQVQAKVLDDNDMCRTTGDVVRLLDVPSCSRVTVDDRYDNSLQSNNFSRSNLTNNSSRCNRRASGDKVKVEEQRSKPHKRVTKTSEGTHTPSTSRTDKKQHSARCDQSSSTASSSARRRKTIDESGSSSGVDKERTVARRRSVRLQQSNNPPSCVRQSGQDSSSTDLSASAVNESIGTQLSVSSSLHRSCLMLNLAMSNRRSIDDFAVVSSRQRRPLVKTPKNKTSCKENIKVSGKDSVCVGTGAGAVRSVKSVGGHSGKRDHSVGTQLNTSRKSGSSSGRKSSVNGGSVCDTSNWKKVIIEENRKSDKHPSKTLVMTSLHTDEQDMVRSVVKRLGGYRIASGVSETTTHVICGNDRRTLNVLLGICRGSWLLSLEWIFKSLECNRWLDEEPYEQSDFFPAAQISRLERLTGSGSYTQDLFSRHSPVCVAANTVPSRTDLVKLIKLCAGQVTQCLSKCRVCVGKVPQEPGVICVSEQWVLDSITAHCALPPKAYRLDGDSDTTRGDSSPEY